MKHLLLISLLLPCVMYSEEPQRTFQSTIQSTTRCKTLSGLCRLAKKQLLPAMNEAWETCENSNDRFGKLSAKEVRTIIDNVWTKYFSQPIVKNAKTDDVVRAFYACFQTPFVCRLHLYELISDKTAQETTAPATKS